MSRKVVAPFFSKSPANKRKIVIGAQKSDLDPYRFFPLSAQVYTLTFDPTQPPIDAGTTLLDCSHTHTHKHIHTHTYI